jgi:nucleotide-binding universal stress UspA family protein
MKKRDLKNILVPVDFSPISEGAIETAQRLAMRSGATVHLVHVHEYFYSVGFMTPGAPVPASMITFRQDDADRAQKQLANLAKNHGIPITNCYVRNDIPVFNGVCKAAKQTDADLIVLQTHGRTGIARIFEGSQAERIVQHSPCPVLVVRERRRKTNRISSRAKTSDSIDTILVPVDFSRSSFKALEYAIDFADRVAARLVVFHSVHLDLAFTADGYAMCDLSALIDGARRNAEKQMQEFVRSAKFRAVKFETAFKMGSPALEICNFAEKRDVDLIITATHGRTGLKHMLMGSVAERVVRHAQRPVLVVPSHPAARSTRLTPATRQDHQASHPGTGKSSRSTGRLTKRNSNLLEHPFPERRKTNKFRESHAREG